MSETTSTFTPDMMVGLRLWGESQPGDRFTQPVRKAQALREKRWAVYSPFITVHWTVS